MTFADSLNQQLLAARAIAGSLGLRPHTITRVVRSGDSARSVVAEKETPITEANGQPPKIRWLNGEELTLNQLNPGTVEIGPITPLNPAGGTDIALLRGDDLQTGDRLYFRITGPHHADGALYRRHRLDEDSALHYTLQLVPVEQEEP